ncbi:MAG: disulfide bond formation protein B [Rhodocyclaceae bacterium]
MKRFVWLALAGVAASTVAASLALTGWLDLHPCHLCIFQRLLFMLLAVLASVAGLVRSRGAVLGAGGLSVVSALGGMAVAAYQSWLQWQPVGSVTCASGPPGPIEKLVEWLGQLQPELFLATGFCEDKELTIFGLSLANLAFIAYAVLGAIALWLLVSFSKRSKTS